MAPSLVVASIERMSSVPEDRLDDSELAEYLGDNGQSQLAQPNGLTKRMSSVVGEALNRGQSVVVDKSSQVIGVFTNKSKEDSCCMDYIETARSLLHRIHIDSDEIRNIVTGGAVDAWYPAASPGPVMPNSVPVPACGPPTNRIVAPTLLCNPAATHAGNNIKAVKRSDAPSIPVLQRTPLRPTAALFQPTTFGQKEDVATEAAPKTTLLLRNIPDGLSRSMVMEFLRARGFADHVAFIYLPMNLRTSGNFSYAFVDFDSTKVAEQCKEKLEGFMAWSEPCEKALELAWSETQGLSALVQRYRDSPIMHGSVEDEVKPAMFKNGVRTAFPRPTKPIRAPRLRRDAKV